jgi:hypothetical protein
MSLLCGVGDCFAAKPTARTPDGSEWLYEKKKFTLGTSTYA